MSMTRSKPSIWEVLESYADVRDEFDEILWVYGRLHSSIQASAYDVARRLEQVQERLDDCDLVFRRFKCKNPHYRDGGATPSGKLTPGSGELFPVSDGCPRDAGGLFPDPVPGDDDTGEDLPFPM